MSVTKPPITWIGTAGNNIWQGYGRKKLVWVNHIMDGTLDACDSWFSNPASQASANFGIGKDGRIHMYVDPEGPNAPWANGALNHPDATVLALQASDGGVNPNFISVSCEHEGHPGDAFTAAQLQASTRLAAYYLQRFGIPLDGQHILGHYEFDSVNRARCPGWSAAQWATWFAAVRALLTAGPDVPSAVGRLNSGTANITAALEDLMGEPDTPSAQGRIGLAVADLQAANADLNG